MQFMKNSKLIITIGIILVIGLTVYYPVRKLAREHVNQKTAVTDHPLSCASCHVYTSKNKLVSKMVNADYLSPFNIVVSSDGNRLYVVAQDVDQLLVVDTKNNQVLNKINV